MTPSEIILRLQGILAERITPLLSDEPFALVDFPDHSNVGDSAIWLGELAHFQHVQRRKPTYVASIANYSEAELRQAVPAGPIFIHGGGNFGDLYRSAQDFREHLMERFGDRRIIQLPQSIHYGNSAGIVQTARAIERHGRFTLLVRDQASFDLAQQHFSCETMLCPDMAFGIGLLRPAPADIAVSALLRTDKERVIEGRPSGSDIFVDDWVREVRNKTRLIQLLGGVEGVLKGGLGGWRYGKFERIAQARLDRGAQQLARGRVVVTDRLHAHIISLLLGRPHAVLDNSYAKIERFMTAWGTDGALTHRSRSLDDALAWARRQAG